VTLTLPETVIDALDRVDHDLSRAVVRIAQPQVRKRPHPAVELATFGSRSVIVVKPSQTLERIGVVLVPLPDGRALISFDESLTASRLELKIEDALEDRALPEKDAEILTAIRELLKDARRSPSVTVAQRNIIVLEHNGRNDHNGKKAPRK